MPSTEVFNQYVEEYEKWYEEYPEVYQSEVVAIREHLQKLPENIRGIEVGLGTGRFSLPLGIKEGVEPSEPMAAVASKRGIEVMNAAGERLPYRDMQFDFVLYVTICYLDNVKIAFEEAHRVLKREGALITAFLDKEQPIATAYKERGKKSKFFADAHFHTPEYVQKVLLESGFKNVEFNQTLFGNLNDIRQAQTPESGYGKGSFVVAMATKK